MNTYNSFNELAAGQTALHSDMSVFNTSAGATEKFAQIRASIADLETKAKKVQEERMAILTEAKQALQGIPQIMQSREYDLDREFIHELENFNRELREGSALSALTQNPSILGSQGL